MTKGEQMNHGRMFRGCSVAVAMALFAAPFAGMAQEPGALQIAAAIGEEQVLPKTAPKTTTTAQDITGAKPATTAATDTAATSGTATTGGMSTSTMVLIGVGAAALLAAAAAGGSSTQH